MTNVFTNLAGAAAAALMALTSAAMADDAQIARGHYLVIIAGCSDCHTPGALLGSPDMKRYLGGSDVGFSIPTQGRLRRAKPDAGQRDRLGKMDARADRDGDPHRQDAGRKGTQPRDALARARAFVG